MSSPSGATKRPRDGTNSFVTSSAPFLPSTDSSPPSDSPIGHATLPAFRKRARQSTYDERVAAVPSASAAALWLHAAPNASVNDYADLASLLTSDMDMDTLVSERDDGGSSSSCGTSVHPSLGAVSAPTPDLNTSTVPRTNSKSGHRGIRVRHLRDGTVKYDAMLCVGGTKVKFLGAFDSLETAIAEYDLARAALRAGVRATPVTEHDAEDSDDAAGGATALGIAVGDATMRPAAQRRVVEGKKRAEVSSGYRGVRASTLARGGTSYRAIIKAGPRRRTIGTFSTAEEAARAYDAVARMHFGAAAKLNFPHEHETAARVPRLANVPQDDENDDEEVEDAAPQAAAFQALRAPFDATAYLPARVASTLCAAAVVFAAVPPQLTASPAVCEAPAASAPAMSVPEEEVPSADTSRVEGSTEPSWHDHEGPFELYGASKEGAMDVMSMRTIAGPSSRRASPMVAAEDGTAAFGMYGGDYFHAFEA